MKKTFYLFSAFAFVVVTNVFGQKPTIELTFTAEYYGQTVPLDSIYVENLTHEGDTTLYAPNNILVLNYTLGMPEINRNGIGTFILAQNRPNPFMKQTDISIFLPHADHLQVSVISLLGQRVAFFERSMDAGNHSFVFYPGDDKYYILTVIANSMTKAIKMVSLNNHTAKQVSLNYQGTDETMSEYKSNHGINVFGYSLGDQLRFTGFAKNLSDIVGSDVIEATPAGNENYLLEIIEGIPCPETPTVTYEGQTYKTVQIGTQCWFKENLNVGIMIDGTNDQTNNSQNEKYCYNNDMAICTTYGGLYQWNEMMQYTTTPGLQGICPTSWHLPTDTEWTMLTDYIGNELLAGAKMKETGTLHWNYSNINVTNEIGFTALPGGKRVYSNPSFFEERGNRAYFWTSTESGTVFAYDRDLDLSFTFVYRGGYTKVSGFSVRCVKD